MIGFFEHRLRHHLIAWAHGGSAHETNLIKMLR